LTWCFDLDPKPVQDGGTALELVQADHREALRLITQERVLL